MDKMLFMILRPVTDSEKLGMKFSLKNRNVNPIILKNGDGKNSPFVTQGTLQFLCASQFFPFHGSAVVIKYKFSTRGYAAHGEFVFHHAC